MLPKNGRASFANWYSFVDGNRINLFLLRTARVVLMPHLSLAACRNRDQMDVDTDRNLLTRSSTGPSKCKTHGADFNSRSLPYL